MGDLVPSESERKTNPLHEGEVPLSEIGRLMQENGVEISIRIYQDHETKFPKVHRRRNIEFVDHKNLVVLSSSQGLFGDEQSLRILAVYLGPESASQDPQFFEHLPSVEFLYAQNNSGLWQCDLIKVWAEGHSMESIAMPIINGKVDKTPDIDSQVVDTMDKRFHWNQRTKMEYVERQFGKYVNDSAQPNPVSVPEKVPNKIQKLL